MGMGMGEDDSEGDSDEYGELDDTAFLEAATQFEKENTPSFQQSPRPPKRRKINPPNESTDCIPATRTQHNVRRRPFIGSDDESGVATSDGSDDAFDPPPIAASHSPRLKSKTLASTELVDGMPSHSATSARSASSTTQRNRSNRSKSKGKESGNDESGSPWKKFIATKKKDRIHTPAMNLDMTDIFYTQPPREHSPPWKPRGAIWQKPTLSIGVHRPSQSQSSKRTGVDATKTIALAERQSTLSGPVYHPSNPPVEVSPIEVDESPRLPARNRRTENYDLTQELADLPSDAFASSSSSPQKQNNDDVVLVSERRTRLVAPQTGLRQTTLFGREGVNGEAPPSQANKRYNFIADQKEEPQTHHKLDPEAMKTWVYPTNLGTKRDYQFNIVARGLFHNLLVALPTGLGKTFIAATIMLNWFRWTVEAQIVFVAPTKPLVSQQVEACFNIAGIPRSQTTMLTGGVSTGLRAEEWANKRVFFMTPQTLLNDLKSGIADPKKIVLVVVDEAHRATGSYAYVEVVSFMRRFNPSFRILALTATPGADVESVQKVIDGLDISRVEIRTETSLDIREYVHHRKIEKRVFTNNSEMEMCMDLYSQALQSCVNKVAGLNAFWSSDPLNLTPYGCTQSRQKWYATVGKNASNGVKGMVNAIFSILASISQGMELLKYHGIGPFYTKMKDFRDSQAQSKSKYKKEICESAAFKKLMVRLHTWVTADNFIGHPKLEYLQEVILDHFVNAAEGKNADGVPPSQTRIMVFAHFRDSAEEIVRVLKKHQPMIRPRVFVGQASAKNSEGMGQKEQLDVIEKFKMGTYNTLVATSIGEEGLDIGEVDLIICYDSKASPIRMLQRMGRTGRKRQGKIVMLQMEGKEENDSMKAKDTYEKMQELIAEGSRFTFHDEISRRILPRDVQPVVDERIVDIPKENFQLDWLPEPKKGRRAPKRPPKKFHMPDGVISGFVTAGRMDEEVAPKPRQKKKATPVYASEELVSLPPLDTVLLNDLETKELERKFQTVFDDDDAPMVGELNLGGNAARQRILSRTKYFRRPGRVTQGFVDTLRRMHAMDDDQLDKFRRNNHHHSNCEPEPEISIVVPDDSNLGPKPAIQEEMWVDDDPASQPLPNPKVKPGPKPRAKATSKAKTTPKTDVPRGRPCKDTSTTTTPARQPKPREKTPRTPHYRISELVDEAASSSPPPTDPHMRLASQAESIGSDDTVGENEIQDTQAYRLDSDLVSFIADDDEEVDVPDSSLPSLDFGGLGKGTQAVVKAGKPQRPRRADKIFSSDSTDDDAIVSSDSDDEMPIVRNSVSAGKGMTFVVDSTSEDENKPIQQQRKRARRVVDDDEDDE